MAKVNAQEYTQEWAQRLKGSTEKIRRGVDKVTEAPGMKAAKQQKAMRENLLKAIDDGTWARRVSAVSLEDWRTKMVDKGINRIAAGVDGALEKVQATAEKLLAAVDATQAEVSKVPRGNLEDNIQRMVINARGMAKRKIR